MLMMVYTQPIACPNYLEGHLDVSAVKKALLAHPNLYIYFTSEQSVNSVKQSGQIICKVLVDYDHLEVSDDEEYAVIKSEDILLISSVFLDRSEEVSHFHYSYIPDLLQFCEKYMMHLFNQGFSENNLLPLKRLIDIYCNQSLALGDRANALKAKLKVAAESVDHAAFFNHVQEEMNAILQANVKPNEYYFVILLMLETFQQKHYLLTLSLEQRKKLVLLQGRLSISQILLESQSSVLWRAFSFFCQDDYHGARQIVVADAVTHGEDLEMIEKILLNQRDQLEDKLHRFCLAIPENVLSKRWTNPEYMKNKNCTGDYYKAIVAGIRLIIGTKNLAVSAYEKANWTFTEMSAKTVQPTFKPERLSGIEKLISDSVVHLFDAITDWEPEIAIKALKIVQSTKITEEDAKWLDDVEIENNENNDDSKEIDIPVRQLIDILSHPCPQNRAESYPYVMPEAGYAIYKLDRERIGLVSSNGGLVLKNGRIILAEEIIRNDERDGYVIAKEKQGVLSLTAYEHNNVVPVTKDFVVEHIQSIIKRELSNQNIKLSMPKIEASASSSSSVSSSPNSTPSTSFSSSPPMSFGSR